MSISEIDVARVAELANLELTDAEKRHMMRDLNSVLEYFSELNDLDTTLAAPTLQVLELSDDQALSLREDVVAPSLNRAAVLDYAPDTDGTFFKVPKVIER